MAERVGFWGGFPGGSERLERCQRLAGSVTCPRALTERAVHLALAPLALIVLNEAHLERLLRRFVADYYHPCRTHLSLQKD